MRNYTRVEIERAGYRFTGVTTNADVVGYGALRRHGIDLNVSVDSLRAFRVANNVWEIFFAPDTKPFRDVALLP